MIVTTFAAGIVCLATGVISAAVKIRRKGVSMTTTWRAVALVVAGLWLAVSGARAIAPPVDATTEGASSPGESQR